MTKQIIFDKKNILIIGGAGFIGSHLCEELAKKHKVICVDNFSSGSERNIDHLLADANFRFIRHDISQPLDLEKFSELEEYKIKWQGIQEIYYLACPMSPKHFLDNRQAILLANSYGVINGLELAKKYQAKFLHFSSSVVYGPRRVDNQKITENDLGQVDISSERSAYDEGMRFSETIVSNYAKIYNFEAKILRLFRIYGPRMKMDDGNLIPDMIDSALDNKEILIYGNSSFASSLCYVSDCIDAAVKAMDSNVSGPINIGSDVDINLTDLAQKIITITKSKSKIKYSDSLLFLSSLCLPDISKARNELGWMPIVPLDKGLDRTIYELRANKGLKGVISSF